MSVFITDQSEGEGEISSALPSQGVLQSCVSNKYMDLICGDDPLRGYIRFTGDAVWSPYAKIAFEESEIAKGCFHIRCCYNNKYWTRKSPEIGSPIVAEARQPKPKDKDGGANQEDQEPKVWEWDCTLFKVEQYPNGTISIRHLGTGDSLCVSEEADERPFYVKCVGSSQTEIASDDPSISASFFKVVDSSSIVILPRFVAFKGDNGKYLRPLEANNDPLLQFSSPNARDFAAAHEVQRFHDGTIGIKSVLFHKYWRRTGFRNWILADLPSADVNDPDTIFTPYKVGPNKVSLRSLRNGRFCSRLTADNNTNCLNAGAVTAATPEATLEIEELILSREIYDVNFRLDDARIYDERIIAINTMTATNLATNLNSSHTFRFAYKETTFQYWHASVSFALGVRATIRAGIPLIKEGRITLSAEFQANYEWGETTEITKEFESIDQVTVPPNTKVTANLIATEAKFDIPFSYTQRDTLLDGDVITYERDDGVYSGGNMYNVHTEISEEPIN